MLLARSVLGEHKDDRGTPWYMKEAGAEVCAAAHTHQSGPEVRLRGSTRVDVAAALCAQDGKASTGGDCGLMRRGGGGGGGGGSGHDYRRDDDGTTQVDLDKVNGMLSQRLDGAPRAVLCEFRQLVP